MACRQGQDRRSGSTTQNCGKCERQRIQGKFFSLVVETHNIQSFFIRKCRRFTSTTPII